MKLFSRGGKGDNGAFQPLCISGNFSYNTGITYRVLLTRNSGKSPLIGCKKLLIINTYDNVIYGVLFDLNVNSNPKSFYIIEKLFWFNQISLKPQSGTSNIPV